MERLIETNVDKKMVLELETKSKLLHEKNKTLFSEVVSLGKMLKVKRMNQRRFNLKQHNWKNKQFYLRSKVNKLKY